ncbi:hypothetical protein TVAG_426480 [Trichomonas vaginalis G3]|uniref:Uncharacterized protein n=1 Tax=Trichomonas vaginalis (strain ATCC PRA-98 / G3) TaxID=412133 RepID=A2DYR5_TRIV3|nr:armadillo (ARM) repeat-containing protein family [Trichomonas vaginalis G3]EAY14455.1 hypothetical protein TVAG_426480 [Trichomonas vaginalis G3]KAI5519635.1 armadillo (ARM) repeat-containing protein family [Trichomonas vaginalis G3]|eukprot:XP_001326678.1 hypothetical protein [Trichomonas vaginalis G3]
MDELIKEIEKLTKVSRILQPEQMIMTNLNNLDQYLNENITQDQYKKIEHALLSLFSINSGNFSIPCALQIACSLVSLYNCVKTPQFFDLFSLVVEKQTTIATIIATGYVIRYQGQHAKSQLPRFVEHILKQGQNLDFAVVYALRCVFKTGSKTIEKFVLPAFQFAKRAIMLPRQTTILACLKLFKILLRFNTLTPEMVFECISSILREDQFPVIKNEIASLVARCAFIPISHSIKNNNQQNEWAIGGEKDKPKQLFAKQLKDIKGFPIIMDMSIMHFLDLITPEMIAQDSQTIFTFIRSKSEANLQRLIPMLPEEFRNEHFKNILKEVPSPIQLHLLSMMSPDNGSVHSIARAAVDLSFTNNKLFRRVAIDFFVTFSKEQPKAANEFLAESLKFLIEDNTNNLYKTRRMGYIAKTILNNINAAGPLISDNRETINQLIEQTFSSFSIESPKCCAVLHILSALPEEFGTMDVVSNSISNIISQLKGNLSNQGKKTLKAMIIFRSVIQEENSCKSLVDLILNNFQKLPIPVIKALCEIVPKYLQSTQQATLVAEKIIERTTSLKISTDLIKNFIKRPLPTGLDLLKLPTPLTPQQIRDQQVLERIVLNFPSLFNSCSENSRVKIYDKLIHLVNVAPIARLYLLAICQSEFSNSLPTSALNYFIQQCNTNNLSTLQLSAESVGSFLVGHPNSLNNVISYVEKLNTMNGCFIMSAISSYVSFDRDNLLRAFIYISCKIRDQKLLAFAALALSSLCYNNMMNIVELGISSDMLSVIFQALQNTAAMQPIVVNLLSAAFSIMIETISVELQSNSLLVDLVFCIINSIRNIPISYSHEAFYSVAKSLFTFAYSISNNLTIKYPMYEGSPTEIQLSACDCFSISGKFNKMNLDTSAMLSKILSLLQRTSDDRASNFILTMAKMSEDTGFWISNIRRILLTSSLLETQSSTIEPTPTVKECCLKVCLILLGQIKNCETLNTEHLDDIISSACKATNTDLLQLQMTAFPVLQKVIELFKCVKTEEGNNLLSLYDSQFAQAVKSGFSLDLSVAGKFLYSYLTFNTENIEMTTSNILKTYVDGLSNCKQRSQPFFELSTHLCTSARNSPVIFEEIKDFLKTLTPMMSKIVTQSMSLFKNLTDWRQNSKFREFSQSFYPEMLPNFVWLQSFSEILIDYQVLVSFFLIEISFQREKWLFDAAFDSLKFVFTFAAQKINPELIELSIRTVMPYLKNLSKETTVSFIIGCAKTLQKGDKYDNLRYLILSISLDENLFDSTVISYVVFTDQNNILEKFVPTISKFLTKSVNSKFTTIEKCVSLYSLLSIHYKKMVGQIIPDILSLQNSIENDYLLEILNNCLMNFEGEFPIDIMARFCIQIFRRGGMLLIARLLISRPNIGIVFLQNGGMKSCFLMAMNDFSNFAVYGRFIELAISVCQKSDKTVCLMLCESVTRLVCKLIVQYGNDVMKGHQTVQLCVSLLKKCQEILNDEKFLSILLSIDSFDRQDVVKMLEIHIQKAAIKKKAKQLATFSSNTRARKSDDWQTLELSDDD